MFYNIKRWASILYRRKTPRKLSITHTLETCKERLMAGPPGHYCYHNNLSCFTTVFRFPHLEKLIHINCRQAIHPSEMPMAM